jgi:hypothetical protein
METICRVIDIELGAAAGMGTRSRAGGAGMMARARGKRKLANDFV